MGFRRIRHGWVDSTNERAFAALTAGEARHGDVHLAIGQTAGRGRRGRTWESAPGEGLYLSAVLLPPAPPPHPAWTLAGGLAVCDACADLGLGAAALEWPNDLVVGGAKLAGVLVETRGWDARRPAYVLGIGLNVAQRTFPAELLAERAATSLALLDCDVSLARAEDALLARLEERVAQVAAGEGARLAADFLAAADLAGRRVRLTTAEAAHEGELVDLTLEEGILLATPAGGRKRIALELVRGLARC